MTYSIDYSKLDNEIAEINRELQKFKQAHKDLDPRTIEKLRQSKRKTTVAQTAGIDHNEINALKHSMYHRDLSYYKRSDSDTIEDATRNCIEDLGETTQLSLADRTKFAQQLAAQTPKAGGIYHIPARNASLQHQEEQQEQKIPAWLRSNLIHRHEFEHEIIQPPTQNIKNASVDEDENASAVKNDLPYFLQTSNKFVQRLREFEETQEPKPEPELTPQQSQLKSASTSSATVTDIEELHPVFKRSARLITGDGFV
jgi:hypothetical protein